MLERMSATIINFLSRWGYRTKTINGLTAKIYGPNSPRIQHIVEQYRRWTEEYLKKQEKKPYYFLPCPLKGIAEITVADEKVYFLFTDPFTPHGLLSCKGGILRWNDPTWGLSYALVTYSLGVILEDETLRLDESAIRRIAEAVEHKQNPRIYALMNCY
jgi:hypothetical protein